MTRMGTSYFNSERDAVRYYRDYYGADAARAVRHKLKDGKIHISLPPIYDSRQRRVLIDNGTRWALEDKS